MIVSVRRANVSACLQERCTCWSDTLADVAGLLVIWGVRGFARLLQVRDRQVEADSEG